MNNHPHSTGTSYLRAGVGRAAATGGLAGAVVGGAISAAKNIKAVKNNEISKEEAVRNTAKEAAGTGLATAAGVALAGALGIGGIVSLLVVGSAATGVKYFWDTKTVKQKKIEQ